MSSVLIINKNLHVTNVKGHFAHQQEVVYHHVTNVKGHSDQQEPVYQHVTNVRGHTEQQQFHKSSAVNSVIIEIFRPYIFARP